MLKNKMLSAMGGAPANYIEDVFSTYLYTGNGSTQTINNGIDLAGDGGLVWVKARSTIGNHRLFDTDRGVLKPIYSNLTNAQATEANTLTAFNADGFTLGSDAGVNQSSQTWASWTFRKQPKFFDVVTYTGNGVAGRAIAHSLESKPGAVIVKRTDSTGDWYYRHENWGNNTYALLNSTAAFTSSSGIWGAVNDSSVFYVGGSATTNISGATYVAYLFAHNAGGFGLSGTDNVVSCGSYTGGTIGQSINLGFEPQWLLTKNATSANDWRIWDNMRGVTTGNTPDAWLIPNLSNAEATGNEYVAFNANGFTLESANGSINGASNTYIYIAIRRGPMKTPTTGTSVFTPIARTGTGTAVTVTGFQGPLDSVFVGNRTDATDKFLIANRLTAERYTLTSSTAAETVSVTAAFPVGVFGVMNGFNLPATTSNVTNKSATTYINYGFTRAPGFFDVCCYTGTGVARTVAHNLGVAPELMIVKGRSGARAWTVYHSSLGATKYIEFDTSAAFVGSTRWNDTAPTSSVFTVGTAAGTNVSTETYVAYLFATCAGVSKVGSYTGTGTTLQVNCGFTGGARFVLIKRTDSTGGWYVWDSARGIVAGNDPYLLLNSTAAEVTSTDYIDTYSAGFEISSTAPAAINASGGSFIFLAIA